MKHTIIVFCVLITTALLASCGEAALPTKTSSLNLGIPQRCDRAEAIPHTIKLTHAGTQLQTAQYQEQQIPLVETMPEQMDGTREAFVKSIHKTEALSYYRYSWNCDEKYDSSVVFSISTSGAATLVHEEHQDAGARHGQDSGWILDTTYSISDKDGVPVLMVNQTKTLINDGKETKNTSNKTVAIPQ